ncbi:hypothetical protein F7725_008960 [Dissostichus mawsoni]|uniref:HAP1 N-terminal domain-containing protein n=1 Tax=Dissostichus mawsoni TaxID=36200 RepID=A0A7J5Z7G3_DISMA|nr:hypothetical protein F7725_008960 [Dissostichus mawsoni]
MAFRLTFGPAAAEDKAEPDCAKWPSGFWVRGSVVVRWEERWRCGSYFPSRHFPRYQSQRRIETLSDPPVHSVGTEPRLKDNSENREASGAASAQSDDQRLLPRDKDVITPTCRTWMTRFTPYLTLRSLNAAEKPRFKLFSSHRNTAVCRHSKREDMFEVKPRAVEKKESSTETVLSGDRVEQMTKTYNDIDVVSHLLAERDRDLELAARIGQSLLQRNHRLQERNEAIEEQLAQTIDQITVS